MIKIEIHSGRLSCILSFDLMIIMIRCYALCSLASKSIRYQKFKEKNYTKTPAVFFLRQGFFQFLVHYFIFFISSYIIKNNREES